MEEKICIQNTEEYRKELESLMNRIYSKRSELGGSHKRTVLDRIPENLVEEIIAVTEKRSKQPAQVRKFLTWINAQVVVRVISATAPIDKLPKDETIKTN